MKKYLLIICLICISWTAQGVEVGGEMLDDSAHLGSHNLILNGAGVRSKFIFDVYVVALYLGAKKNSATAVMSDMGEKRITLHLLRDVNAEELLFSFKKAIKKNHTDEELLEIKEQLHDFEMIFHALVKVKKGDVIFLDYQRSTGTQIRLNGSERGIIVGTAFYTAMLKIWLGEQPAQDDLKQKLLGWQ